MVQTQHNGKRQSSVNSFSIIRNRCLSQIQQNLVFFKHVLSLDNLVPSNTVQSLTYLFPFVLL